MDDDDKKDDESPDAPSSRPTEDPSMPQSPFAKFPGELTLGKTVMDCYVLDPERPALGAPILPAVVGLDAVALHTACAATHAWLPAWRHVRISRPPSLLRAAGHGDALVMLDGGAASLAWSRLDGAGVG